MNGKLILFLLVPILFCIEACRNSPPTLFLQVPSSKSNILFNNKVVENDSINSIKLEFLYNGGGVAVADFNGDSLQDLYFTASTSSNKLYLNKGGLSFEDITDAANVSGQGAWSNGVTVVDINNDKRKDIYICTSIKTNGYERRNILYVNQGVNAFGKPTFKNMAPEYGLADTSHSVQAAFFDYDKDGDLDMYLATTKPTSRNTYTFGKRKDTATVDHDKLYRNDWDSGKQHPVFTNVSVEAGINEKGYGLGVTVGDVNNDNWPDVYVTNDFIGSDHLYINNKNGTFTNRVKDCLKHTSQNAMGNDISDVNNDGLADLIAVDMNPEDNYRKQKNMAAANYSKYRNMVDLGYSLQFVRNTLQINQGLVERQTDSLAVPVFGDISYYAGVAETDWSWTPSIADFDNDGLKDLLVTNGYPKDVTDHDYVSYRRDQGYIATEASLLSQIPEIRVANYAFRNSPELTFENVSKQWGLDDKAFSTGATYADLDNDGDLDYVINNINEQASLYENKASERNGNNFIRFTLSGEATNVWGTGAKVIAYYNGAPHVFENYPTRGYLSSVESIAHFGLGKLKAVDSVEVIWPNGKTQSLGTTAANQTITLQSANAKVNTSQKESDNSLFTDINAQTGISVVHTEYDFIDFDYQRLLPHKLSEYGPALATGDVDANGLEDIFIGGAKGVSPVFLLQQSNGTFRPEPLQDLSTPYQKPWEELGALLMDIDNDSDLDLYLCSGSNEFKNSDTVYRDRLFVNDGKGQFREEENGLPKNFNSKQVVKAFDFDRDGDLDLFIGSRSVPNEYPKPASGYLYRNETESGRIKFHDITSELAPELNKIGLITDAVWSDYDNDNQFDLIVCGEFMDVSFFKNTNGKFKKTNTGVTALKGLWNSITPADVDNDGRTDYILGNLGLNSFYKGTTDHPFTVYADDFDKNGSFDAVPFLFLKDEEGRLTQYPAFTRDDIIKQMTRVKGQFPTYKSFATATSNDVLTELERKKALTVSANYMQSAILRNRGQGMFTVHPLPYQAQWSPIYGVLADDFNEDGYIDLLVATNDLGTEVNTGQYDALNSLVLIGDGKAGFIPLNAGASGIHVPSNGKAVVKFLYKGQYAVAVSQNKGPLRVFKLNGLTKGVRVLPDEVVANVHLKNGSIRREEMHWGNSYLSQSERFTTTNSAVLKIVLTAKDGRVREIRP